jgi:hypothetical protein
VIGANSILTPAIAHSSIAPATTEDLACSERRISTDPGSAPDHIILNVDGGQSTGEFQSRRLLDRGRIARGQRRGQPAQTQPVRKIACMAVRAAPAVVRQIRHFLGYQVALGIDVSASGRPDGRSGTQTIENSARGSDLAPG